MMPLGSEGDPPGTQWLKRNLRGGPTPEQQAQIDKVSDNAPALGSWQFAIQPYGTGWWNLVMSPPGRDDWQIHSVHRDLGAALGRIKGLRADPDSAGP